VGWVRWFVKPPNTLFFNITKRGNKKNEEQRNRQRFHFNPCSFCTLAHNSICPNMLQKHACRDYNHVKQNYVAGLLVMAISSQRNGPVEPTPFCVPDLDSPGHCKPRTGACRSVANVVPRPCWPQKPVGVDDMWSSPSPWPGNTSECASFHLDLENLLGGDDSASQGTFNHDALIRIPSPLPPPLPPFPPRAPSPSLIPPPPPPPQGLPLRSFSSSPSPPPPLPPPPSPPRECSGARAGAGASARESTLAKESTPNEWTRVDLLLEKWPALIQGSCPTKTDRDLDRKYLTIDTLVCCPYGATTPRTSHLAALFVLNTVDTFAYVKDNGKQIYDKFIETNPAVFIVDGFSCDNDEETVTISGPKSKDKVKFEMNKLVEALVSIPVEKRRLFLVYLNIPGSELLARKIRAIPEPPIVVHWGTQTTKVQHLVTALVEFIHCISMMLPPVVAFRWAYNQTKFVHSLASLDIHMLISKDDTRLRSIEGKLAHPISYRYVCHNYKAATGNESRIIKDLSKSALGVGAGAGTSTVGNTRKK
jgi:hypothetical protein